MLSVASWHQPPCPASSGRASALGTAILSSRRARGPWPECSASASVACCFPAGAPLPVPPHSLCSRPGPSSPAPIIYICHVSFPPPFSPLRCRTRLQDLRLRDLRLRDLRQRPRARGPSGSVGAAEAGLKQDPAGAQAGRPAPALHSTPLGAARDAPAKGEPRRPWLGGPHPATPPEAVPAARGRCLQGRRRL